MRVIIVGNGVVGVTAARVLREHNLAAKIAIYTAEEHHHYPRPWLIDFLAGRLPREGVPLRDERWYGIAPAGSRSFWA